MPLAQRVTHILKVLESKLNLYIFKYYIYAFILLSLKISEVGFFKNVSVMVYYISSFLSYPFMFFNQGPTWNPSIDLTEHSKNIYKIKNTFNI